MKAFKKSVYIVQHESEDEHSAAYLIEREREREREREEARSKRKREMTILSPFMNFSNSLYSYTCIYMQKVFLFEA